jgi:DNA-damage-inducible protein J
MATTTMVHVRVDENIKAQATETLAAMGLTVSDAIRVFLTRIVIERQLPFALRAPSDDSLTQVASLRAKGGDSAGASGPPRKQARAAAQQ